MDSSMFEVRKKVPHSLDIERRLTTCNIDVVNRTNTVVSLRGTLNQTSEAQMDALVAELCAE